ncbi:hypothetical protein [Parasitella parasitica]|uniref:Centromere protein K n=1 Tax=Parasitella parasitica TaxID=35722 RepID=A0A0B7NN65_9FUNG|nr:hypothetical protein [Parasitella parasitica]
MSQIQNALQNIIAQATQSYKDVATKDPVVQSSDDKTARGEHLDHILRAQQKEKKELWNKLHSLENKRINDQANAVFNSKADGISSSARNQLHALMFEHREINSLVAAEIDKIDKMECGSDDILEIEFRDDLDRQIKQYKSLIEFAQQQLDATVSALREDTIVLSECEKMYSALKVAERKAAQETYFQLYPEELRKEQEIWESQYKKDTHDLIDLLEEFYPPHTVEVSGESRKTCEFKTLLEDLLNQSVDSPDDPYIKLVPGTYWPPYVQTLVKGGIVKYHPTDSTLIRVHDFAH